MISYFYGLVISGQYVISHFFTCKTHHSCFLRPLKDVGSNEAQSCSGRFKWRRLPVKGNWHPWNAAAIHKPGSTNFEGGRRRPFALFSGNSDRKSKWHQWFVSIAIEIYWNHCFLLCFCAFLICRPIWARISGQVVESSCTWRHEKRWIWVKGFIL